MKEISKNKFAGIDIPTGLKWENFFNLYLASLIMGCLMTLPAVIQPAFLKEIIKIPEHLSGSINAGLQNIGQLATLLLVGVVGVASDRYGRKNLIITGFSFCLIFFIAFGYSKDIAFFLGMKSFDKQLLCIYSFRFLVGIGLALGHPQFVTMVADYTSEYSRGKGMAIHAVMMSVSSLCVYGLFTQMAQITGVIGILYVAGFISLVGIIVSKSGLVEKRSEIKYVIKDKKETFRLLLKSFSLKIAYTAGFITRANLAVPSTIILVWMVKVSGKYGYTPLQATAKGGIIMMVGSIVSLTSFYLIGIALDRIGRIPVLIVTSLITGIGYFLIATTENPFSNFMFLHVSLLGLAKNGAIVAANTLTTDAAPKPLVGSVLGILNTVGTLGIVLFLQLSGYLFDNFSFQSPFILKGLIDFFFGVLVWLARSKILSEINACKHLLSENLKS